MATAMSWQTTYRDSQVGGATPIGLLIALFDRLAGDLSRAADAIRSGEIERRCKEINHGLIVLGQLESWLDFDKGGESARQIGLFYQQIRASISRASLEQCAEPLEEQIRSLVEVRCSWQLLDSAAPLQGNNHAMPRAYELGSMGGHSSEGRSFSQSA